MAVIRVGLEVRDDKIILKDVYDLTEWYPVIGSSMEIPSGHYLVTVYSSLPKSGVAGDNQTIGFYFEPKTEPQNLGWQGVPDISALLE